MSNNASRMNRIVYTEFGGPEVLTIEDSAVPDPAAGQVRVRMVAASVNPTDAKIRRGELEAVFPSTFPVVPGVDVAGVVDAVGPGVSDFVVGDAVFGAAASGSYADYALMNQPTAKPDELDWEVAASLSTAGETAVRAYRQCHVVAGQTLLIHGAAGGIGSIVTQLAVRDGATVVGTVGAVDDDRLTQLGGIAVRYGDGWIDRVRAVAPAGIDAVIDTSGHGVIPGSISLTGDPTRVITLVDYAALELGAVFTGMDPSDRADDAMALLGGLAAAGKLVVPIWVTYPLAEAALAHRELEAGLNRGKIVLKGQP